MSPCDGWHWPQYGRYHKGTTACDNWYMRRDAAKGARHLPQDWQHVCNVAGDYLKSVKWQLFHSFPNDPCMRCGREVMQLATLCTNRQSCCLPLHMAVRLTPAIDSVQVWTCYNCYAIVQSVWSEVVFVRCVTKRDRQKFEQHCAVKFCVKLGKSATVTYEKLQRAYGEHSLSRAQILFRRPRTSGRRTFGKTFNLKNGR
jgi:hypothetical protein